MLGCCALIGMPYRLPGMDDDNKKIVSVAARRYPWAVIQWSAENGGHTDNTKSPVVVTIVGKIPVAVGGTRMLRIIDPGAATQHLSISTFMGGSNRKGLNLTLLQPLIVYCSNFCICSFHCLFRCCFTSCSSGKHI